MRGANISMLFSIRSDSPFRLCRSGRGLWRVGSACTHSYAHSQPHNPLGSSAPGSTLDPLFIYNYKFAYRNSTTPTA